MLNKAESAGMMRAVADFVRDQIVQALAPLASRIAAVEARQPDRGPPGERGADGAAGRDGQRGERGEAGEKGERGFEGPPGAPGERGADGMPGRDGERGPIGEKGDRGADGLPGRDGMPGERGEPGPPGQSIKGDPGLPGEKGERGADGMPGARGEKGDKGDRGDQGPIGKLPMVRAWEDRVFYEGDVVTFEGQTFQALRDTGRAPGHSDWICLAERGRDGRDGLDGKGFEPKGTWDETAAYAKNDTVAFNGATFTAKYDRPGVCPGDGWQLHSARGKTGKPGEQGPKGDMGPMGPAGPRLVRATCDDDGLLTLTSDDGSQVTCDLYPVLIKLKS